LVGFKHDLVARGSDLARSFVAYGESYVSACVERGVYTATHDERLLDARDAISSTGSANRSRWSPWDPPTSAPRSSRAHRRDPFTFLQRPQRRPRHPAHI